MEYRSILPGRVYETILKGKNIFCFDVAVYDRVHDVETMHGLCLLLTAS